MMHKLLVFVLLFSMGFMAGCRKEDAIKTGGPGNESIAHEIFKAGYTAYLETGTTKSSHPVYITVNSVINGLEGGNIQVSGSITGNVNTDEQSGEILGSILSIGLTENITDYAWESGGNIWTMNGSPRLTVTGTFTLKPDGSFGPASGMQFNGGIRITGPDCNKTINLCITVILNENGQGGTVSGTIGGEAVRFTF